MAVIAYGWETPKFYAEWFGDNDPLFTKDLKGPSLNLASPQSELAPMLLDRIKYVLMDEDYIERIKKHYRMFKDLIDKESKRKGRINEPRKRKG